MTHRHFTRRLVDWTLFLAPLALILFVMRNPISQGKWDRIQPGMTKEQVIAILGRPDALDCGGSQFEYHAFLNPGWVEFDFDNDNVLVSKNDESVNATLR